MGLGTLALKVLRVGADLGARLGTSLAATSLKTGDWGPASACLGVSALCIAAKDAIEAHGEEKARKKIEGRLRELLDGQNDLRAAVAALKADEAVDEKRALALLNLLSADDAGVEAVLQNEPELAGTLASADNWLQSWCKQQGHSVEALRAQVDAVQAQLLEHDRHSRDDHDRIEGKVDMVLERVTPAPVRPLHTLPAAPPRFHRPQDRTRRAAGPDPHRRRLYHGPARPRGRRQDRLGPRPGAPRGQRLPGCAAFR